MNKLGPPSRRRSRFRFQSRVGFKNSSDGSKTRFKGSSNTSNTPVRKMAIEVQERPAKSLNTTPPEMMACDVNTKAVEATQKRGKKTGKKTERSINQKDGILYFTNPTPLIGPSVRAAKRTESSCLWCLLWTEPADIADHGPNKADAAAATGAAVL